MKTYCCKCHTAFSLAETRVAIDSLREMHENCYNQHLAELYARSLERQLEPHEARGVPVPVRVHRTVH